MREFRSPFLFRCWAASSRLKQPCWDLPSKMHNTGRHNKIHAERCPRLANVQKVSLTSGNDVIVACWLD